MASSAAVTAMLVSSGTMSVFMLIAAAAAILWISALVSVLLHDRPFRHATQLIWILVVILAGPVGALLYFLLGREGGPVYVEPVPDRQGRADAIADPWSEP